MAYDNDKIKELDQEAHDLSDELIGLSAVLDEAREDLKERFEKLNDEFASRETKPQDEEMLPKIDPFNKEMERIRDGHRDILNLLRTISAAYDRGAKSLDETIHDPKFKQRMDKVRNFVKTYR